MTGLIRAGGAPMTVTVVPGAIAILAALGFA
jgi:hypothetical protein